MEKFVYFPPYHGKENFHSSIVLYLLKRVYYYNADIFYKFLTDLYEDDNIELKPTFITQEKNKSSVPDFSITQEAFKITVEAKEKYNQFDIGQLRNHLKDLQKLENYRYKFLIALAPIFAQEELINDLQKEFPKIKIKSITYQDLYEKLSECMDKIKDYDFLEVLNEFSDFCEQEGLIDTSEETIMVRLAGQTIDFNVQNNKYYDKASSYIGYKYLGLYKDKKVQYVGKIKKVINARRKQDGSLDLEALKCIFPKEGGEITASDKQEIERTMDEQQKMYDNTDILHSYFFVEKFFKVENFEKDSKGALPGKKKFYLKQFGLKKDCSIEDIVNAMKNKKWGEL